MAIKTNFHGNPNVGLNGFCFVGAEPISLLGVDIGSEELRDIEKALKTRIAIVSIAGTPMTGVFLTGNSKALLVPSIIFDHEKAALEKLGLPVKTFETQHTCLGNNIVASDHGALVSPDFSDKEIKRISDLLGVPAKRIEIAELTTPGACIAINGLKGVIHRDAAAHEIEMAKSTLGLTSLEPASVNLGSPYVSSGLLCAPGGFVVGDLSGGPEIVHIDNALGYAEASRD